MTVLLDIDGVLLGWDGEPDPEVTGFSDFRAIKERFFSWHSDEQLALILDTFTDVQWHTTWVQLDHTGTPGTDRFTELTGFGPLPILVDEIPVQEARYGLQIRPRAPRVPFESVPSRVAGVLLPTDWWKLNAVAILLEQGKLPGKIVWIDDDIAPLRKPIFQVLRYYDAVDRFRLISPHKSVLSRTDIIEAAEWIAE